MISGFEGNSQQVKLGMEGYYDIPASIISIPASIVISGSVQSALMQSYGFSAMSIALTSTQAGTISVQRYIDIAGTQVQGAAYTGVLVANTALVLNINSDGTAWESFQITVTNSSGSTAATLSVLKVILHNPFITSISATNPSVGTTGTTAPTSATEIGIIDGSGHLVGISSTTPLPVTIDSAISIGKVSIDQTTPGTTNGVAIEQIGSTTVNTAASGTMLIGVADGSGTKITSTLNSGKQSLDVNLSGATNITTGPTYNSGTGTITTNTSVVNLSCQAYSAVVVEVTGTYAGITVVFEQQAVGTGQWYQCWGQVVGSTQSNAVTTLTPVNNSNNLIQFTVGASVNFRVRATAYTSGTANVFIGETSDNLQYGQTITVVNPTAANLLANVGQSGTWNVRNQDASGNGITTNSTTYTSKFGFDTNLLGTLGTAFTTAGFVDIKGADGNVFVRQATAGNLNATVVGQATGSAVPATAFYDSVLAQTALPAAASAGNLTGTLGDKFGRKVIMPYGMRDIIGMSTTTITSTTGATSIIAAIASTFTDIVCLILSNSSASATDTTLSDGTNSYHIYVPAGDCRGFSTGVILPATTVNTAWTVACGTSVASLFVTAIYVKDK